MPERVTVMNRSEKSAEAVLAGVEPVKGRTRRSVQRHTDGTGIRSPQERSGRGKLPVKPGVNQAVMKRAPRGMARRTQGRRCCTEC